MLRLDVFGGLTLLDLDGHHVAPQRRRLALLALMAAAGDRGMSRDKLVAYLWPESASEKARHALEQLLYSLRRQVPGGLILGTDPLRLDSDKVSSDLAEFGSRAAHGDLAGAVALYRGPFLDGFYLSDAPEFERWTERERARLAGEYARALRTLAEQARSNEKHTAEVDYRRQLAAADPLSERTATELVRGLAETGDWVGASRAAREYQSRVRGELPGVPVRDLEALLERLREERRPDAVGGAAGRYVVERELGRGSAAIVYLARDRQYDRAVALKILRPELATATDARRFRLEISILARLYHPHILQLYDSGIMPPGPGPAGLFYVMPYVRGESLRQRLERDVQLPIEDAVAIGRTVADALAYAHAQGVVHRDVRPKNILLESGHALVADFGIAAVLEAAGGERLSAAGIVLGVPEYSSPEQGAGGSAPDGRTDIYSLGCVLYEMLTGDPPFTGATRAAVFARHRSDPVLPLRTVRPDVPPGIEQAVLRALAKRPEDRFLTAAEFAAALGRDFRPTRMI
jgi:DNA-binding SARP family transcriptional activator